MNYRTPLRKARGLGSAKGGTEHWWAQRVTAVALIPLSLWFVVSVAELPYASYENVVDWITAPWNTILLISLIISVFYHAALGIQVVIEDYVHTDWLKIAGILGMKLLLAFLALASLFATFRIVFMG